MPRKKVSESVSFRFWVSSHTDTLDACLYLTHSIHFYICSIFFPYFYLAPYVYFPYFYLAPHFFHIFILLHIFSIFLSCSICRPGCTREGVAACLPSLLIISVIIIIMIIIIVFLCYYYYHYYYYDYYHHCDFYRYHSYFGGDYYGDEII